MPSQISAGIVIFRRTKEGIKFLFLYHGRGYWNFPKGKIESRERSLETAFREVSEETGLRRRDLKILSGFKVYDRYFFVQGKDKISKLVIFFLAETNRSHIRVSHEHEGYAWFNFREIMKVLKHKNTQLILKKAYEYLKKTEGNNEKPKEEAQVKEAFPVEKMENPTA
ncbi:MAG: hypothetical protein A3A04_00935 [Candidatus Harrisonbacteria bacterium RIFCSPLOWO2_01_FULL_40_28]|uniref:Bis(5'-nucleosyl)-tetraphosphatase [asymmetrical] n=2 Tax=Candidatus Harrisoniibacteriota TaxID=1817905 RepID=A0A1G1ZYH0_9BACT|nr:MAG: hypothetical protein A3A04_00935 [Candidatus Harrisonbacteria bacterium RIFCSPLOWO2_01_FULL_40_28]OGY69678.1 MAG: hypothetical protein A2586_01615 [Candidatus Harrisonbacteria bacterium RIFOXYD1_FULL_40_9]